MDIDFKASILVVDASADSLVELEDMLQQRYHVSLARSGAQAIRLAQQTPVPDLVLLAADLPDMDACAVLAEIRCHFLSAGIAVVVVISDADVLEQQRLLQSGASDIVARPLLPALLRARIQTLVQLARARVLLGDQRAHLAHLIADATRDGALMQDATVIAMASLAESRDPETGNHIRRTQHYVAALARELRFQSRYMQELTDDNIGLLFKAAPLHDIGKVGVPDAILLKQGKLTDDEFNTMKLHTVYGRDAIAGVEKTLGGSNPFLRYAGEICHAHHEYWDGSGYPQGLAGTAIPLSARLMAVADVYDALTTARSYRPAFTHETAVELIRQARGEHFDPDVVDAMLAVEEQFMTIAGRFPAG